MTTGNNMIATAISLILLTGFAIGLDKVIKWLIRLYRNSRKPPAA